MLRYDTVPARFLTKTTNSEGGAERFAKAQSKEREASPTKIHRRDRNTPRETSGHKPQAKSHCTRDSWEKYQALLGFKKNRNSEIYVQCKWCTKHSRIGTNEVVKKLGGLQRLQERNAHLAFERGSQVIKAFSQLRIVERTRPGNRHGPSSEQEYWALMRDHFRRWTKKGIVDPENRHGVKIHHDGCADRWEKGEDYRQQMILHGQTKAELQSWDTHMREGLDDNAEYHQPRQLRKKIHATKLKDTLFQ